MVLQPHNSKLTIELLQDFSKFIQALNQLNPKLKLRTYSSLQEKGKSNKFNTNPKSERRANYQLHNHSTKHKTTLVRDRVTGEQVGGEERKQFPNYFTR